ncbi:hypothetical protein CERSUDRAFT_78031 [Gelatoporia subvermispora B]|uniref:Uncharacterized protein n=1 Tax=Ceriporiopsis subvermispora (strain B) TaxID=914234 RepID=M2Q451_CERS8|nr:hypothetical protein CERSUDRAFT_78031 [Gelatoporia subvermispora B]
MAHQTTFTPPIVAQLRAHRADLARTGFYLADARVRRNVVWKRPEGTKGRSHILVQKKANALACDDIPVDPAYLILVGRVSDDSFYMTSDANWKPSSFAPSLADAKASCLLSMPPDFLELQVFRADWEEAMDNLRWLQSQVLTKGFNEALGVLIHAEETDDKVMIKIKHKLFDEDREETPVAEDAPVAANADAGNANAGNANATADGQAGNANTDADTDNQTGNAGATAGTQAGDANANAGVQANGANADDEAGNPNATADGQGVGADADAGVQAGGADAGVNTNAQAADAGADANANAQVDNANVNAGANAAAPDDEDDLGPEFHIDNWPCWTDDAKDAIEDLKFTHRVVPIPLYGLDNQLVKPCDYRRVLRGATVEVHFSLRHWSIGKRGKRDGEEPRGLDAFSADVFAIHVVKPAPPPMPSTPRKRKVSSMSPVHSPVKRRRIGMWYFVLMASVLLILIFVGFVYIF